jgi:GGDEF domain-containing protein
MPLSISVGGALVRPGEEVPELIERADAGMYREKGRT